MWTQLLIDLLMSNLFHQDHLTSIHNRFLRLVLCNIYILYILYIYILYIYYIYIYYIYNINSAVLHLSTPLRIMIPIESSGLIDSSPFWWVLGEPAPLESQWISQWKTSFSGSYPIFGFENVVCTYFMKPTPICHNMSLSASLNAHLKWRMKSAMCDNPFALHRGTSSSAIPWVVRVGTHPVDSRRSSY